MNDHLKSARENCAKSWNLHFAKKGLAKEHQSLAPIELLRKVMHYVKAINLMVDTEIELKNAARQLDQWPGLIGKKSRFDNRKIRKFAADHLAAPKSVPASKKTKTGPWTKLAAIKITEILNGDLGIYASTPCSIIWASDYFVNEDPDPDEGTYGLLCLPTSNHQSLVRRNRPELDPVVRRGKVIWVKKDNLPCLADAITCIYGPAEDRARVYAYHLAKLLRLLPGGNKLSLEKVFGEIRHELESRVRAGTREEMLKNLRRELVIPSLKNKKLKQAADMVLQKVPLYLKDLPEGETKGSRYTFRSPDLLDANKPHCATWERTRLNLIKAVLSALPEQTSPPQDLNNGGYIQNSEIKPAVLIPDRFCKTKPGPRPRKTSGY